MFIVLAAAALVLSSSVMSTVTNAQGKGQLVIVSWGGSYQDALREAFFKPFEKETGIKVVEQSPPSLAKVKAMVTTGAVEWDLVDASSSSLQTMIDQGLLEPVDYGQVDKSGYFDNVVNPYGVGNIFTAVVMGYNTKSYSRDNHPRTWAEYWDVKKFPGARALVAGQDGNINAMEVALLADGVPKGQLYPLDTERAWRSLEKIRPHVTKWTTTVAEASQGLADGQFALAMVFSNRVQALKDQGAPLDYEWNEALIAPTFWVMPKGAPNKANATAFQSYLARRPELHARLSSIMPVGPVLKRAAEMLDAKTAALVPNSPANLRQGVFYDSGFWAKKGPSGKSNVEEYVAKWNLWRLKQ
jgi:putative spermidine/putrescine transport system substrate-binding protein